MEDFAESLLAERPGLPVVRGNVSDSWIHGLASSPNAMKALANVRPKVFALASLRTLGVAWGIQFQHIPDTIAAGYDSSLRWTEHTWGLANQHFVPGLHGDEFRAACAAGLPPNYERMIASWKEHDRFAFRVEDDVVPKLEAELHTLAENVNVAGLRIVVFNSLPWRRDGVVDFAFPFMGSLAGKSAVKSVDDGEVEALQTWGAHSHRNGRFVAKQVPPLGYRTYVVTEETPRATSLAGDAAAASRESTSSRADGLNRSPRSTSTSSTTSGIRTSAPSGAAISARACGSGPSRHSPRNETSSHRPRRPSRPC